MIGSTRRIESPDSGYSHDGKLLCRESYCTVLVQEAGVVAEVLTLPDQYPPRDPRNDTAEFPS